jgi:hypothetical protein
MYQSWEKMPEAEWMEPMQIGSSLSGAASKDAAPVGAESAMLDYETKQTKGVGRVRDPNGSRQISHCAQV